ncbi:MULTISPECIES: PEP-CTERM sorting domain-containing protein [unclassified Lentimonas]|uniref:PEP-CTERM sorting domain-containing protein n=1 Tax=unclassified Lentimonas TaxID=2630993 RepID=UPI0013207866|nr:MULTISPECIES: PEP-CTERM sorting domain-containing protein [unclassified Lentimonas]CAA6677636.1 Unannotated [Lentimonas sp. CC4]CAA6684899.1 Unannotated [Lentimonas sp. CC6]CAA7077988.1 Unannotated [Lentimonas sp. CC4]CAA7169909.1 Unannotated [Lentimonas sp. CC21]CAA7180141.1 Unannotated [Lentimonas sp. CC8]
MKVSLKNQKLVGLLLSLAAFSSAQADIIGVQAESGTFSASDFLTVTQATIDGSNAPLNTQTLGGGSAIMATGGNSFAVDATRSADFSVTIAEAGDYVLWARYIIPDLQDFAGSTQDADANDSFQYTAFDAVSTDNANFNTLTATGTPDLANYIQLGGTQALTVGAHTFSVAPRENGFVFDGFVITNEAFNETAFNTALAVIPEPGAYALLGGLLALGSVAMRRRA